MSDDMTAREDVTKLCCIDVDDPLLQDPDFRDIAKLRGNVPPLEK